jgi:hypothetical protein
MLSTTSGVAETFTKDITEINGFVLVASRDRQRKVKLV